MFAVVETIHRIGQHLLGPGGTRGLEACLARLAPSTAGGRCLDVGAGYRSRLRDDHRSVVAVDVSLSRAAAARRHGALAVVATATALPFRDGSFEVTASVGLLHHLPDVHARAAVAEMSRVTAPDGRTVIIDAVLPEAGWRRPIARVIRAVDLGSWMRPQDDLEALFDRDRAWSGERFTYAWTGLEALAAVRATETGTAGLKPRGYDCDGPPEPRAKAEAARLRRINVAVEETHVAAGLQPRGPKSHHAHRF
jgi:SAM-dependent methyltransferase